MKTKVALLGCGTIGAEVAAELIDGRMKDVILSAIMVRDIHKERNLPAELFTTEFERIINDDSISTYIEVMGGLQPAYEYARRIIGSKRNYITANKELIANYGSELFAMAKEQCIHLGIDAAVGGGIPVINTLLGSLNCNHLSEIDGILNGTTNYMLTRMQEGKEFAEALTEAKMLGYAEPDPSYDLNGSDAKFKIAILANLAFKCVVNPHNIPCEGIDSIEREDFIHAAELDSTIKLVARARRDDLGKVSIVVGPHLINLSDALAQVNGVMNAVKLKGDLVGGLFLEGYGAGPKPTASAILGDLGGICRGYSHTSLIAVPNKESNVELATDQISMFYARLLVEERVGVLRDIGEIFAKHGISISSMHQKMSASAGDVMMVLTTHMVNEEEFTETLKELLTKQCVKKICCILRMLG